MLAGLALPAFHSKYSTNELKKWLYVCVGTVQDIPGHHFSWHYLESRCSWKKHVPRWCIQKFTRVLHWLPFRTWVFHHSPAIKALWDTVDDMFRWIMMEIESWKKRYHSHRGWWMSLRVIVISQSKQRENRTQDLGNDTLDMIDGMRLLEYWKIAEQVMRGIHQYEAHPCVYRLSGTGWQRMCCFFSKAVLKILYRYLGRV